MPDLVFSEMKFLQRQDEEPEATLQPRSLKKKRKKEHTHSKEGEISAFFTSGRPALAEKEGTSLTTMLQLDDGTLSELTRRQREQSPIVDATTTTVIMSDEAPILEFGSKCPRHTSASHVSWSESNPAPSIMTAHARLKPSIYTSQLNLLRGRENKLIIGDEDSSLKHRTPLSQIKPLIERTSARFGVSSIAPSPHRMSRSHSYPQHKSSPGRMNLVDWAARFRTSTSADSSTSMPPFVLVSASVAVQQAQATNSSRDFRSRATSPPGTNELLDHRQLVSHNEENHTNIVPKTSSDWGRVLQQCNDTFHKRSQATQHKGRAVQVDGGYSTNQTERQGTTELCSMNDRIPTVRFVDVESLAPLLPNFAGPSIYEQQAQRQQLSLQGAIKEEIFYDMNPIERKYLDDEARTDYMDQAWDDPAWDDPAGEPASQEVERGFGITGIEDTYLAEDTVRQFTSESQVVVPGFWRPNRLY